MAGNVHEVSDSTFQTEVLEAKGPVLVDFWAPWCGPCRAIAPMIDQLANENVGAAKVVKVNIDDNIEVAQTYGIQSIPTLIVFSGGQPTQRFLGAQPKARLQEALDASR